MINDGEYFIECKNPNKDHWAVTRGGAVLNNDDLEFEYEPIPSARTNDFIGRTRFNLEEAKALLQRYIDGQ